MEDLLDNLLILFFLFFSSNLVKEANFFKFIKEGKSLSSNPAKCKIFLIEYSEIGVLPFIEYDSILFNILFNLGSY